MRPTPIARQCFSAMFKTCTSVLPVFSTAGFRVSPRALAGLDFHVSALPSLDVNFTAELLNE